MSEPSAEALRIGDAERTSAMNALDVHLSAGRLDAEEYGERAGQVSIARTSADLEPLFRDLPSPHPTIGVVAARPGADRRGPATPTGSTPRSGSGATGVAVARRDRGGRVALGGRAGEVAVAASPFVALVLFFALQGVFDQAWLFFLLIPAAGAVVYGGRSRRH